MFELSAQNQPMLSDTMVRLSIENDYGLEVESVERKGEGCLRMIHVSYVRKY